LVDAGTQEAELCRNFQERALFRVFGDKRTGSAVGQQGVDLAIQAIGPLLFRCLGQAVIAIGHVATPSPLA
jgi:hypothetical protein